MDSAPSSLQEYIKTGEYFIDAKKWYSDKYIDPFSERTYLLFLCGFVFILLCTLLLNIRFLLPIVIPVKYSLFSSSYQNTVQISKADHIKNNPLLSIADIMVRRYLINREEYDYSDLKRQFTFIENNSTRIIYKEFYNYMSIDNQLSPVLRYQQSVRRKVNIISTSYPSPGEVVVVFESIAKNSQGEIFENMVWEAKLNFDIDPINVNAADGTKFNFIVSNYKISLLEDKIKK